MAIPIFCWTNSVSSNGNFPSTGTRRPSGYPRYSTAPREYNSKEAAPDSTRTTNRDTPMSQQPQTTRRGSGRQGQRFPSTTNHSLSETRKNSHSCPWVKGGLQTTISLRCHFPAPETACGASKPFPRVGGAKRGADAAAANCRAKARRESFMAWARVTG